MSSMSKPYVPAGPVDPVAAEIAAFFGADDTWQGLTQRPASETRSALKANPPSPVSPDVNHVEELVVPTRAGSVAVRFYRPKGPLRALVAWAHGGGFVLGSMEESDGFARLLANKTGCAVASIDYRLAPEHKFPAAVDDVCDATRWLGDNVRTLTGVSLPLIAGGDSAGANLATVAARKLNESGERIVAAQILAYPCTDSADAESLRRFEPPFLTVKELAWLFGQYLSDEESRGDPDFAPIRADSLDCLPPAMILTAEHDILTEQAEEYGRRLADAGVEVRFERYPGMIHGFLTMDVFYEGAAGRALDDISGFVEQVTSG